MTPDPKDWGDALQHYGEVVKKYNLERYITFRGYTKNTLEEMVKSQCVLFPSYSEAQPMTIIEAMLLGVPVVAYDCKYGPASMIEHGVSGMLCKVGDIQSLAKHTYAVVGNSEFRQVLSNNARLQAKEFTNSDNIFDKWLDLFSLK